MSPAAEPSRAVSLLAIRGPLTGTRLEIRGDRFLIGRSPDCDLVLEDATVTRHHAVLHRRGLAWLIEDMASRHGTRVNRCALTEPRALAPNDEIEVGSSLFLFDSEFDVQNAEYSDRSVYFAKPSDDTMEAVPATLAAEPAGAATREETDAVGLMVSLAEMLNVERSPFGEALDAAVRKIARLFRSEALILALWDTSQSRLRTVAVVAEGDVIADQSVLRRVHHERRALLVNDRPNLAPHPSPDAPAAPKVRSLIAVPLVSDGHSLGVLSLERYEAGAYTLRDLQVVQAIGHLLGVFVEARQRSEALLLRLNYDRSESPVLGESVKFRKVMETIQRIARTPASVLLTGETGTGKEVLAREIHRLSLQGQSGGPFVAINCGAVPESLFESELFGHEKGSFTGAVKQHRGLIEAAQGGTLFLDEIGEMSLTIQPKLLRFLQERTFTRVGGTKPVRADVRLIAATNRDLLREVQAGRFREDLYHRLAVLPIELPPLRERRPDIRLLVESFVRKHARDLGREIAGVSNEAMIALEKHEWPGNIRELANCIERAVLLCDGKVILPRHLVLGLARPGEGGGRGEDLRPLALVEKEHILRVLRACGGNQVRTAETLGIHRNTLHKKLEEYGALE